MTGVFITQADLDEMYWSLFYELKWSGLDFDSKELSCDYSFHFGDLD